MSTSTTTKDIINKEHHQLNQLKLKYLNQFSLADIQMNYQIYLDLIYLKKWRNIEFNNTDSFIYLIAYHDKESPSLTSDNSDNNTVILDPSSIIDEINIIVPCRLLTDWNMSKIQKYFEKFTFPINCKKKSFILAIQDEDSSVAYYQLSEEEIGLI